MVGEELHRGLSIHPFLPQKHSDLADPSLRFTIFPLLPRGQPASVTQQMLTPRGPAGLGPLVPVASRALSAPPLLENTARFSRYSPHAA